MKKLMTETNSNKLNTKTNTVMQLFNTWHLWTLLYEIMSGLQTSEIIHRLLQFIGLEIDNK